MLVLTFPSFFLFSCSAIQIAQMENGGTNDASTTAQGLVNKVFLQYRVPRVVISDQGSHFINALMDEVFHIFETLHAISSGYRPQTAGLVERMNQALVDMIRGYVNEKQSNWEIILPWYCMFIVLVTYHRRLVLVPIV